MVDYWREREEIFFREIILEKIILINKCLNNIFEVLGDYIRVINPTSPSHLLGVINLSSPTP